MYFINQSVWMTDYKMHGGIIKVFGIRGCHGNGSLFVLEKGKI